MTPQELQSALIGSGVPCRIQRQEVVIQVCVFCTNAKWNLECNAEKGVFHAWCCKRGGRLDQLLRDLTGQEYRIAVQRVQKDPTVAPIKVEEFKAKSVTEVLSAMTYLERRGITADLARFYGIVFVDQPGHQLHGRLAIPARDFWTGDIEGWTGRSYTGQRPKYITTLQRKIITGWKRRSNTAPAVVVEGPLDGVMVHQAGFSAAVLSGIGGAGVEEWAARMPAETEVVVMLDGDAVEQAQRLYWKIAAVRRAPVLITLPPEMDPASLGAPGVRRLVEEALSA